MASIVTGVETCLKHSVGSSAIERRSMFKKMMVICLGSMFVLLLTGNAFSWEWWPFGDQKKQQEEKKVEKRHPKQERFYVVNNYRCIDSISEECNDRCSHGYYTSGHYLTYSNEDIDNFMKAGWRIVMTSQKEKHYSIWDSHDYHKGRPDDCACYLTEYVMEDWR